MCILRVHYITNLLLSYVDGSIGSKNDIIFNTSNQLKI